MGTEQMTTVQTEQREQVATIWLNRPEVRNAMNEALIKELTVAFNSLGQDPSVRVIVLRGRGRVFCSGGDLNWMKAVSQYSYEQNLEESRQLAHCFQTIYQTPKPTIALIHGAAMGGANGLHCACDFAYASHEALFAFSEVKIGLVPATIAPYVLKRMGERNSKDLMLTGRKINGVEAEKLGLINRALAEDELEKHLALIINELLMAGPDSVSRCKLLVSKLSEIRLEEVISYTAESIARARISSEGQQGMQAFFDKKKPYWISSEEKK